MTAPDLTPQEILALPLDPPDTDGWPTIREFLIGLLEQLWRDGEAFSGKHPFGDSGWQSAVYQRLIEAGAVEGALDPEFGHITELDHQAADRLMISAIWALGEPPAREALLASAAVAEREAEELLHQAQEASRRAQNLRAWAEGEVES